MCPPTVDTDQKEKTNRNDDLEVPSQNVGSEVAAEKETVPEPPSLPVEGRPRRTIKEPAYLKDYIRS